MIPLVLIAALVQSPQVDHTVSLEPASVEVGQPVVIRCEIAHPPGISPRSVELELDPSSPWVLLDSSREPASETTTLLWRFVHLAPGEAEPPDLFYSYRLDEGGRTVRVEVPLLTVTGVLAEVEDAPRPLASFRVIEDPIAARPAWMTWILIAGGAAGALGLLALGFLLPTLRRLLRPSGPSMPAAEARLQALREENLSERARHYALTRLLREELDLRGGVDRRGLSDEEWQDATRTDPKVATEAHEEITRVLAGARAPKYAGEVPTAWTVEETFTHAAAALAALEAGEESE